MTAVRVAFRVTPQLLRWTGGYNYLRNLLRCLQTCSEGRITPVLFGAEEACTGELKELVAEPFIVAATSSQGRVARRAKQIVAFGYDVAAARALRNARIDVVFQQGTFYGPLFPIPTVLWLPDFQHRHLPEMFSKVGYWRRELGFRMAIRYSRTIMVSSQAAREDCVRLYNVPEDRVRAVPFAVSRPDTALDPSAVRRSYHLPERFFFLPNQLWRHKNHALVCQALGLLRRRGISICIVASGSTEDLRHRSALAELTATMDREGVSDIFRHLGAIPYGDVIALMRGCTGLINPSLFEGWSTTIEEAKSFGVPVIASELAVHREQLSEPSIFFDPHSAEGLAAALLEAEQMLDPGPRFEAERAASSRAACASVAFARNFEATVSAAASVG